MRQRNEHVLWTIELSEQDIEGSMHASLLYQHALASTRFTLDSLLKNTPTLIPLGLLYHCVTQPTGSSAAPFPFTSLFLPNLEDCTCGSHHRLDQPTLHTRRGAPA